MKQHCVSGRQLKRNFDSGGNFPLNNFTSPLCCQNPGAVICIDNLALWAFPVVELILFQIAKMERRWVSLKEETEVELDKEARVNVTILQWNILSQVPSQSLCMTCWPKRDLTSTASFYLKNLEALMMHCFPSQTSYIQTLGINGDFVATPAAALAWPHRQQLLFQVRGFLSLSLLRSFRFNQFFFTLK